MVGGPGRDALEQGDLFPALVFQEFLDELRVAKLAPPRLSNLVCLVANSGHLSRQQHLASPFGPSASKLLDAFRLRATTVPHFGFSMVEGGYLRESRAPLPQQCELQ